MSDTTNEETQEFIDTVGVVEDVPVMTRDEIRAKIFGAKPRKEILENFFGTNVELVQPALGSILEVRQGDREAQTLRMLTDYTYVPGTNIKVFDAADAEILTGLPFGGDMQRFIRAVTDLLEVDPAAAETQIQESEKST